MRTPWLLALCSLPGLPLAQQAEAELWRFKLTPSVYSNRDTPQVGQEVYAIAGWGRTNLRTYYNLNFDPNDAITLGLGGWVGRQHQISLLRIQDDRLHTGQRVTHLVWRYHPDDAHRLTLDLADKRGRADADGPWLQGSSVSLGWDWQRWFVHAALDHKVNFSNDTQKRLSLGWRF